MCVCVCFRLINRIQQISYDERLSTIIFASVPNSEAMTMLASIQLLFCEASTVGARKTMGCGFLPRFPLFLFTHRARCGLLWDALLCRPPPIRPPPFQWASRFDPACSLLSLWASSPNIHLACASAFLAGKSCISGVHQVGPDLFCTAMRCCHQRKGKKG